jgi:hypothetical protein
MFKNLSSFGVLSTIPNISPLNSSTLNDIILQPVIGKWVTLVSNGTNWIVMQGN